MGKPQGYQSFIAEYLHRRPGQEVFLRDLVADYPESVDENVMRGAANRVFKADRNIEVVVKATSWRYVPKSTATRGVGELFQTVAVLKDGRVLVEDEDGQAFWLTEA